jgi:hypothetical protein
MHVNFEGNSFSPILVSFVDREFGEESCGFSTCQTTSDVIIIK